MGTKVTFVSHSLPKSASRAAPAVEPAVSVPTDIAYLYRTHERRVLRWAARLGGPGIDAEDVAQDVFLIAKRRLSSFSGPGKVTTWLFRTTEKVVQAARRKQKVRRWFSRLADQTIGMSTPGPTPGEALERQQEIRHVYSILDRLPERQRRVLILFELEGHSTDEIADLIGARVGTIRVWLFRARTRFMEEHLRLSAGSGHEREKGRQ